MKQPKIKRCYVQIGYAYKTRNATTYATFLRNVEDIQISFINTGGVVFIRKQEKSWTGTDEDKYGVGENCPGRTITAVLLVFDHIGKTPNPPQSIFRGMPRPFKVTWGPERSEFGEPFQQFMKLK